MGRFIDITGKYGPRHLGIGRFGGCIGVGVTFTSRFEMQLDGQTLPSSVAGADVLLWRHSPLGFRNFFSAYKTWEQLCTHRNKQDWSHVMWFSQGVLRFKFIIWLAVQGLDFGVVSNFISSVTTRKHFEILPKFWQEKFPTKYLRFFYQIPTILLPKIELVGNWQEISYET